MGSLAVYLARHYASPPAPGEDGDDDNLYFACGCLLVLVTIIAIVVIVWVIFYNIY